MPVRPPGTRAELEGHLAGLVGRSVTEVAYVEIADPGGAPKWSERRASFDSLDFGSSSTTEVAA